MAPWSTPAVGQSSTRRDGGSSRRRRWTQPDVVGSAAVRLWHVSGSEPRQSSASGATPFGPICTAPSWPRHIWRTSELFAYRSHTGEVRAYVNQCRHRGSELIKTSCATNTPHEPIGVGKRVVCPYHSWTYDADSGRLVGVPGQEMGFPCLNKADYGLSPVPVTESAGGIFVGGEVMRNKRLWATEEVQ